MKECKHKWIRRSNNWNIFRCDLCGILGYFHKKGRWNFEITPYICQKSKCKKLVTKINGVGERYCDEHYVEKEYKDWADYAAGAGCIRHISVNPEDYYENAK